MAKVITIKAIESAKSKIQEYKLTVDRGLYIRVAPSGVKTWLVRYVVQGQQKQCRLPKPFGTSGEGFMSLVEAKALNGKIQSLAREGIDYQLQLLEQQQQIAEARIQKADELKTVNDLYLQWKEDGVNRADDNKYISQSFEKHLLPVLGNVLIRQLTEHDLRTLYRSIIEKGKLSTAFELSKDIGQMMRWAEARQPWRKLLVEGNPAKLVEIKKLLPKGFTKVRERRLSFEEIIKLKLIFDKTTASYANAPNKYEAERPLKKEVQIAMWLCLSTLSRIGALLMTEWKHVNFDKKTWFIPAENNKGEDGNKRDHLVYLSDFALEQFRQLHTLTGDSKWAFPARYKDGHVCIKSASKQIGDRQVKFKSRNRKLQSRVENNSLVLGDSEWTPHDLRRTSATMIQNLIGGANGIFIAELCLNHAVLTGSARHYLFDEYTEEKRNAWQRLGNKLEVILNSTC